MNHTPGPWVIDGPADSPDIVGKQLPDGTIMQIASLEESVYRDQQVANAQLIKAAPEMLEALKQVARCDFLGDLSGALLDECMEVSAVDERLRMVLGLVRDAIAKAEGTAQ